MSETSRRPGGIFSLSTLAVAKRISFPASFFARSFNFADRYKLAACLAINLSPADRREFATKVRTYIPIYIYCVSRAIRVSGRNRNGKINSRTVFTTQSARRNNKTCTTGWLRPETRLSNDKRVAGDSYC